MGAYIFRRLLLIIPLLLGVSLLAFLAMYVLPGDAVDMMVRDNFGASAEDRARIRAQLGLDEPFYVQYWNFLSGAVRGDLGYSMYSKRPVVDQLKNQFPATARLTVAALTISIIVGTLLGVTAAVRRGTWVDTASMVFALIGVSMPSFWLGLVLIYAFALTWPILPSGGSVGWRTLVLPAGTLGLMSAAIIARVTRSSLLEILRMDYIQTARSKGLSERVVIFKHALRNALIPVVTIVGLQVGGLLGGAVVIETVFSRQGIGYMAANAIISKDFPVVVGVVMIAASAFILVNLLVDLSYAFLDPRVRYG